jgi:hypothetical protein
MAAIVAAWYILFIIVSISKTVALASAHGAGETFGHLHFDLHRRA